MGTRATPIIAANNDIARAHLSSKHQWYRVHFFYNVINTNCATPYISVSVVDISAAINAAIIKQKYRVLRLNAQHQQKCDLGQRLEKEYQTEP
jgi:stringent starvation protein B